MALDMIKKNIKIIFIFFIFTFQLYSQIDLESFLGSPTQYDTVINTFKSTRIINNHSIEIFPTNQLDLRISHRFGRLNTGLYELYGLDQAKIRVGLEYGLLNNLMIGFGRSTYLKNYDAYIKYQLINQRKGKNPFPFTIVTFSNIAVNSLEKNFKDYPFVGRLSFCNQLLIACVSHVVF